jgi:tetratricopeptide (TPR) repeat protein
MLTIPLRPWPVRILLLLALIAALGALGWMIARPAMGDSVMASIERSPNLSLQSRIEWADVALKLAPRDPLVHWRRGGLYLQAANEEMAEPHLEVALDELRAAARLSPEDYRVWLALGRGLDRSGSSGEARQAFERAVRLAPNHFDPRWVFGNFLLRVGDRDGSFAQMRVALRNRPSAMPLIFDYAWGVYGADGRAIAAALDPPREVTARMVALLINRGRVDDALAIWREANSGTAPSAIDSLKIAEALFNTGHFKKAYEVWQSAEIADRPSPDSDSLLANGGFEGRLALNDQTPFLTWQIKPVPGVKVMLDRKEPREGQQGFRLGFDVRENIAFTTATQTVPVKPSTSYRLSFSVKSEGLESLSNPIIEVFDSAYDLAGGNRVRVATPEIKNGDREWTDYKLEFTTNAQTEAVTIRIQRLPCDLAPCPIEGQVWFDDFKLTENSPASNIKPVPNRARTL